VLATFIASECDAALPSHPRPGEEEGLAIGPSKPALWFRRRNGELTYEIAYDEPDYHYPSGFMHRMEVTPGLTMTENTGVARTSPISCDRCHIIVEG
jgi:hypothetical protein